MGVRDFLLELVYYPSVDLVIGLTNIPAPGITQIASILQAP